MSNKLRSIAIIALSIVQVACSNDDVADNAIQTAGVGVIYGTVTDSETNEPLQGANVILYPGGKSMVTGRDGNFEFAGLENGGYIVQFMKNGYLAQVESPVVSVNDTRVPADAVMDRGESCLDILLGELDFGDYSSAKAFVISNNGNKAINWSLYSDYNSYLRFDVTKGTLEPMENVAVNVSLLRGGTSMELKDFPIYIQAGAEKLAAIATVNRHHGGKLNSLLVGVWSSTYSEFWQVGIDKVVYSTEKTQNKEWLTINSDYSYSRYSRSFNYSEDVSDVGNMFHYENEIGIYSYDAANGIVQFGEYGPVFEIVKLTNEYLELSTKTMQGQNSAQRSVYKRL